MHSRQQLIFPAFVTTWSGAAEAGFTAAHTAEAVFGPSKSRSTGVCEIEKHFVAAANINPDEQNVSGFEKRRTASFLAFQAGKKPASIIRVRPHFEKDEEGNSPGTHIEKAKGTKWQTGRAIQRCGKIAITGETGINLEIAMKR